MKRHFEELKRQANILGIPLSVDVRDTLKKDLKEKKSRQEHVNFDQFSGMWKERTTTQGSLREKAWK